MKNLSLRSRIILTYGLIILIGIGGLALFAGRQIEIAARNDFEQTIVSQANLVARGLSSLIEHYLEGEDSLQSVQNLVDLYAGQTGAVITIAQPDGKVWLTSTDGTGQSAKLSNAEVSVVGSGQTFLQTDSEAVYATVPVQHDGKTLALVQISSPVQSIQREIQKRWLTLVAGGTGLGILTVIVSIALATSLTRPLMDLRNAAIKLSEGDLSSRVAEGRGDEIGMVAESFNHMAGQVQSMLDEQRAFASNAAHELRTPLTTIRLRTEVLTEDSVDPETQRTYLLEIDSEVKRLANLVNDLMLLSRVETGRLSPGDEQVDMVRLARSLYADLQGQLQEKNLSLQILSQDDSVVVRGSLNHLHIVFQNLLDNAIKYSLPDGHITWTISSGSGFVESRIADTGIGLTSEEKARIFERFYRADESHNRDLPGNGLGLALVRKVVELYGGTIEVESEGHGAGAEFVVLWPRYVSNM